MSRHERDGVIVASVKGEIDVSNATLIGRELMDISNRALGLVVDLGQVEYLDSSGIALLYELHLRLRRRGQGFVVVSAAGSAPRKALELTAFGTRAALAVRVDAGVEEVRRGGGL
ncbi:MAG TPA: STAS domain-containing protein [Solirubrobacteraceae bacterium]